jgi:hypothetical protein
LEQLEDITAGLSDNQHKAIVVLISESSVSAAARSSGLGRSTLYRFLKDPTFNEALREAQRRQMNAAVGSLQAGTGEALAALRDVMDDPKAPAAARVSAASKWIGYALRTFYDLSEVDQLLERLRNEVDYDDAA